MRVGWTNRGRLSFQAALAFILLVFAVFPETANAHGNSFSITPEGAAHIDSGLSADASNAKSHCHSTPGQDCTTQAAFLNIASFSATTTHFDVSVPFYDTHGKNWLLSFDPPPPRIQS